MNNLTAEWIDNVTLHLKWEPVRKTDGVSATYTVSYSPMAESRDREQSVPATNHTEFQMSTTTQLSSVMIRKLDPNVFYQVAVMVNLNQSQDPSWVGISKLIRNNSTKKLRRLEYIEM